MTLGHIKPEVKIQELNMFNTVIISEKFESYVTKSQCAIF